MRCDDLPIEDPCAADWDAMNGDRQRRFCSQCSKHVHNLSAMTEAGARELLSGQGKASLCVNYTSDANGRIFFASPSKPVRRLPLLAGAGGVLLAACGDPADDPFDWDAQAVQSDAAILDGGAGWGDAPEQDPWQASRPVDTTLDADRDAPCLSKPDTPPHVLMPSPKPTTTKVTKGELAPQPDRTIRGVVALPPRPRRLMGKMKSPIRHPSMGAVLPAPSTD